jgi:triosephosphate isomerase
MRKPFVGGNWKMNTDAASAVSLATAVSDGLQHDHVARQCEVAIFPPFVYLIPVRDALRARNSAILLGAQDVYFEKNGAFTGEVSAAMLKDCGVQVVLTGHSERRHVLGETDEVVNRKTRAALDAGLSCILCVGEKLSEREAGQTDAVNERQVRAGLSGVERQHLVSGRLTIAYEPVWAIGTGKNATAFDAQDAHAKIRRLLATLYGPEEASVVRIQYGGSCKASNAPELMLQPDIDGGLIGGASLKAEEFLPIVKAAAARG